MNWNGKLTDETGRVHPDVGVRISGPTVTVYTRHGQLLMQRDDLASQTGDRFKHRELTFGTGAVWKIDRKRQGG